MLVVYVSRQALIKQQLTFTRVACISLVAMKRVVRTKRNGLRGPSKDENKKGKGKGKPGPKRKKAVAVSEHYSSSEDLSDIEVEASTFRNFQRPPILSPIRHTEFQNPYVLLDESDHEGPSDRMLPDLTPCKRRVNQPKPIPPLPSMPADSPVRSRRARTPSQIIRDRARDSASEAVSTPRGKVRHSSCPDRTPSKNRTPSRTIRERVGSDMEPTSAAESADGTQTTPRGKI